MRGYFIHQAGSGLGVQAKINSQVNVLSVLGEVACLPVNRTTLDKITERLPLCGCDLRAIRDAVIAPDFLYIRKWVTDREFIEFLSSVKAEHPDCVVLLEVPTYPYDAEMIARPKDWPLLVKDRRYRDELDQYVDRIVTYCGQTAIFGIPTIMVTNGIDVDSVRGRWRAEKDPGTIDLIAVATMIRQHGYDRVLAGMAAYYKEAPARRVRLHLVGDGPEIGRYRRITSTRRLQDQVVFHGPQVGEALDALYDYCDIGLAAFGMHRIGIQKASALKSREYLARGLPIVGGCPDTLFEGEGFPYHLEFPNDDSSIPIAEIVQFYEDRLTAVPVEEVTRIMRDYAYRKCDMRVAMAPVIEYLRGSAARGQ